MGAQNAVARGRDRQFKTLSAFPIDEASFLPFFFLMHRAIQHGAYCVCQSPDSQARQQLTPVSIWKLGVAVGHGDDPLLHGSPGG